MTTRSLLQRAAALAAPRWGGLAAFLMAAASIIAPTIYLVGDLRTAIGPFAYALADFLFGPVWGASLVAVIFTLRERLGARAPRRMLLALLAAALAAAAMLSVALIRSANRGYHLLHPELHLEMSTPVLVAWATLVAGLIGTGWHLLGWSFILVGSAGWTTRRLPRALSVLYVITGVAALFMYLWPASEGSVAALTVVASIWQGVLFWRAGPPDTSPPATT